MNKMKLVFLIIPILIFSQQRIDGIAAVIGSEIVLDSDIAQIAQYNKAQGNDVAENCNFIDQILMEKMITYQAKQDTLIIVSEEEIQEQVDYRISYFLERVGSETEVLKQFNLQTMTELQTELKDIITNQMYTEKKVNLINEGLDISPKELKSFYNKYKYDLPEVNEEIEMAHILLYPKLTVQHKQTLIDKLNTIKTDIENGSNFEAKAKIYSEDEGSAKNGGFYGNVARGKMVKEFDAVAFNLEEGQISEPFESEFGFHIIKLEKRKGQLLDLRHILLKSTPNTEEITTAKNKLDSIKTLIKEGVYTFKEAAYRFSEDKFTRFNGGVLSDPQTKENKLEKLKLSTDDFYQIAGLGKNDFTDVFEADYQNKKAVRVIKINNLIPSHKLSLDQDYSRIKNYAKKEKEQKQLEKFVKESIQDTFIVISKQYRDCNYSFDWLQEDKNSLTQNN